MYKSNLVSRPFRPKPNKVYIYNFFFIIKFYFFNFQLELSFRYVSQKDVQSFHRLYLQVKIIFIIKAKFKKAQVNNFSK